MRGNCPTPCARLILKLLSECSRQNKITLTIPRAPPDGPLPGEPAARHKMSWRRRTGGAPANQISICQSSVAVLPVNHDSRSDSILMGFCLLLCLPTFAGALCMCSLRFEIPRAWKCLGGSSCMLEWVGELIPHVAFQGWGIGSLVVSGYLPFTPLHPTQAPPCNHEGSGPYQARHWWVLLRLATTLPFLSHLLLIVLFFRVVLPSPAMQTLLSRSGRPPAAWGSRRTT